MNIVVFAPVGRFSTVEEAANGELSIDWQLPPGDDHIACTLSFAACEIESHLSAIPGVSCSTASVGSDAADSVSIFCSVDPGRLDTPGSQSYAIRTTCDDSGRPKAYEIIGSDAPGGLYGAYEFLRILGFRWYSPDSWDRVAPSTLEGLPVIDIEEAPSFALRGFWATDDRGTREFLLWMARNKLNLWSAEQHNKEFCRKLGIRFTTGGHAIFARYADPGVYFDAHPEWYGLHDGERSPNIEGNIGDNICFASAEVRSHIARSLVEDLIDGEWKWVDLINVWALDNGRYCTCSGCAEIGNPTDQIMLLAHDCRAAIVEAQASGRLHRDVVVSIPAYHETLVVPSNPLPEGFDHEGIVATFFPIERCFVHNFADPGCGEINRPLLDYWESWTNNPQNPFKGAMLVGEYYNVSAYASLAIPAPRTMAADIPYYHRSGARLMHYMHVGISDWGTIASTNSQFTAMLWNHEIDVDTFLADYFTSRFGGYSDRMREAYSLLENAMLNAKPMKHYAGMTRHTLRRTIRTPRPPEAGSKASAIDTEDIVFTTEHLRYKDRSQAADSGPSLTQTMDLLYAVERIFDDALLEAPEPGLRMRIASDLKRVRYTRDAVRFTYHATRLRMFEAIEDETCAAIEARALNDVGEALRRETVMPKLKPETGDDDWHSYYRNGLTATWLLDFYEETMERYGLSVAGEGDSVAEVL